MTDFSFSLPTDVLRAALVCVSTEDTRYYLRGVNVDPDADDIVLVSTDGHRLFCGRCPLPADVITPAAPFIVPTDALKKALTGYKGAAIYLERAGNVWTLGDVTFTPVDGTFPDWRRVAPTQKTISKDLGKIAQFNPAYVADMCKVAKAVTPTTRSAVALPIIHHLGSNPAFVTFPGRDDLFVLLMPMQAEWRDAGQLGFLLAHVTQNKLEALAAAAKRA